MNTNEILAKAQKEKKDEYKRSVSDFATGTVGAFLLFTLLMLIGVKLFTHHSFQEELALLLGGIGAYLFAQYARTNSEKDKKVPLISWKNFYMISSLLFLIASGFFFVTFLVGLLR